MRVIDKKGNEKLYNIASAWEGCKTSNSESIITLRPGAKILVGSSDTESVKDSTSRIIITSGDLVFRNIYDPYGKSLSFRTIYSDLFGTPSYTLFTKNDIPGCVSQDSGFIPIGQYDETMWFYTLNSSSDTESGGRKIYCFDGTSFQYFVPSQTGILTTDTTIYYGGKLGKKYFFNIASNVSETNQSGSRILCYDSETSGWTVYTKQSISSLLSASDRFNGVSVNVGGKIVAGTDNSFNPKILVFDGTNWTVYTKSALPLSSSADRGYYPLVSHPSNRLYIFCFASGALNNVSGNKLYATDLKTWSGYILYQTDSILASYPTMVGLFTSNVYVFVCRSGVVFGYLWFPHVDDWLAYGFHEYMRSGIRNYGDLVYSGFNSYCIYNSNLVIATTGYSQATNTSGSSILSIQIYPPVGYYAGTAVPKSCIPYCTSQDELYVSTYQNYLLISTATTLSNSDFSGAKILLWKFPVRTSDNSCSFRGF